MEASLLIQKQSLKVQTFLDQEDRKTFLNQEDDNPVSSEVSITLTDNFPDNSGWR